MHKNNYFAMVGWAGTEHYVDRINIVSCQIS